MKTDVNILKGVSIIEIGTSLYGLDFFRQGSYYSVKSMDSIRVKPDGSHFWRNSELAGGNSNAKGDVFDFVKYMELYFNGAELSFPEVCKKIEAFLGNVPVEDWKPYNPTKEKVKFRPPWRAKRSPMAFKYLCDQRHISSSVVIEMLRRKVIFQEKDNKKYPDRKNLVFAGYDKGHMVYAQRCRTDDCESHRRRFEVKGSDCNICWRYLSEKTSDTLVVFEAVIDALSYMTMCEMEHINYKDFDFISTNGVNKLNSVMSLVKKNKYSRIIVCFDNDKAGRQAYEALVDLLNTFGFEGRIINKAPEEEGFDMNDLLVSLL